MYVKTKSVEAKGKRYEYLQVVEAYREQGKVKQRVVANLGRLDELQLSGDLEKVVAGLARYTEAIKAYHAFRQGTIGSCTTKLWGPPLVFERLWEEQGMPRILTLLAKGRKFGYDPERVAFILALQRLCYPGSDLMGSGWVKNLEGEGITGIELHQMYRTVGWLAEIREELERELFFQDRDLFNQELDLVFLDTTSTYVYRDEETEFCKRGYSRDRKPELPQMVICVAMDRRGWPIAWEVFPGNTADKEAFTRVIEILRKRFHIRRICVVADRGMISHATISLLEEDQEAPFEFILGCRVRKQKEVSEQVLSRPGRYQKVSDNLKVKEVYVGDRRYIVCRNEEEARKDEGARQAMVEKLTEKLAAGQGKSLIGNSGYRRYLKGMKGAWSLDDDAIKKAARFDGVFVLRTNTDLPPEEVALAYKGLWSVERAFREQKSVLEIRPLYHHHDDTRIGHIVASFLALRLEVDLMGRLDERSVSISWPTLMLDLSQLQAVHISMGQDHYRIRTDLAGSSQVVFKALGLRPPSRLTTLPQM